MTAKRSTSASSWRSICASASRLPPFGLELFAARAVFNVPMAMIYRGALPFVVVSFAALQVITYVPAISMILLGQRR